MVRAEGDLAVPAAGLPSDLSGGPYKRIAAVEFAFAGLRAAAVLTFGHHLLPPCARPIFRGMCRRARISRTSGWMVMLDFMFVPSRVPTGNCLTIQQISNPGGSRRHTLAVRSR